MRGRRTVGRAADAVNENVGVPRRRQAGRRVLLMDEVDAALDEQNTQRVAAMLKEVARTSQVVAISHHKEFHELADHVVHLSKASDHTVVR